MKDLILKMFPERFVRYIFNKTLRSYKISNSYKYDKNRFKRYSDSFRMQTQSELIGNIIKHYHVFEKGLTMPETRLGFGQPKLLVLISECKKHISLFGKNEPQLVHAISVIKEYYSFHKLEEFKLEQKTIRAIETLLSSFLRTLPSAQPLLTRESYFKDIKSSFDIFSKSRHSVRNFSEEEIPIYKLENSLKLAKKTPSACNRQSWRTYIFTNSNKISEILEIQGGNRGFGHLTNKLIVITAELGVFGHSFERNQAFVDGGMYAMNLMYALHFNGIATCPLNCSTTPKKDKKLQLLCNVPMSEVFIVMIACGLPPSEFKLASSPRYDIDHTNKFVND